MGLLQTCTSFVAICCLLYNVDSNLTTLSITADGPLDYAQLEFNLPPSSCTLQDVLQVMVALGVVQIVHDQDSFNKHKLKYCMAYGQPRAPVVSSQQLVEDICEAQQEISDLQQRCLLLKQVLLNYPQIAQDPVYMAAFRNTHVDLQAVERERPKRSLATQNKRKEESSQNDVPVAGGASSTATKHAHVSTAAGNGHNAVALACATGVKMTEA
jgi:hypothetical protein